MQQEANISNQRNMKNGPVIRQAMIMMTMMIGADKYDGAKGCENFLPLSGRRQIVICFLFYSLDNEYKRQG